MVITRNDELIECEIKASKFDYLNDFRKQEKHDALESLKDLSIIPNYFFYVCPADLIHPGDIPDYAGLLYIMERGGRKYVKEILKAPKLHTLKVPDEKWRELAIKLYHRLS